MVCFGTFNRFILEKISAKHVKQSYLLVDLSRKIATVQNRYIESNQKSHSDRKLSVKDVLGMENTNLVRICICVPITSKGTEMTTLADSPFWSNLFDSFMNSIDWRSNRYIFRFYLGFDKANELYDTGDAWSEMREEFRNHAVFTAIR
eukprot:gene18121-25475_t